jgi:peptidase E
MKVSPGVCLMAGAGPATSRATVRYHRDLMQRIGKKNPRIAYVGAAALDDPRFFDFVRKKVFGATANVVPVELTKKAQPGSSLRAMLDGADLVFFSGGDVERGIELVEGRDLGNHVRDLARQGKPMEALSAGSIMLGRSWVRFPGNDDTRAERFACLDVVPWSFDTHDEADDWSELRTLACLLSNSQEDVVYGIPAGGAASYDGTELRALGIPLVQFATGTPPRRLADRKP